MNQVVLITGATSGIGKATAELLAQMGYRVYGTGRNVTNGDVCNGVTFVKMDVRDEESVRACVEYIIQTAGRVDVLVNNAGFGISGAVEDTDTEVMQSQLDVNLVGVHRVTRAVLPIMRKQGGGRIVNVSSVAGFVAIPFQAFYSVSKYGVEAYSRALEREVHKFGIKVTLVQPGDTKTGFTAGRVHVGQSSQTYAAAANRSVAKMEQDEQSGGSPVAVARVIAKIIKRRNPPVSVCVGLGYKTIKALLKLLPERLVRFVVGVLYT